MGIDRSSLDLEGSIGDRREETRRSILAKAGLVAGGVGVATLARPGIAQAVDGPGVDREDLMFEGFNNVKDSPPGGGAGAAGDGTTDDSVPIQAWLDASKRGGVKPGTVYFPPGVYRTNIRLAVPGGSALFGHGPHTVIKPLDNAFGAILKNEDGLGDIVIERLTLDGNRANRPQSTSGVPNLILMSAGGTGLVIRDVEGLENPRGFGFAVSMKVVMIENCYIHDCDKDGMNVASSEDVVIQGNVVNDCGDDHIAAPATRVSIVNNVCNAASTRYGAPIAVRGGKAVKIVGNIVRGGAQAGIVVNHGSDVEVADNMVYEGGVTTATNGTPAAPGPLRGGGEGSGIAVFTVGAGAPLTRVNVRDNLISSPFGHGVKLTASGRTMSDVAVSGNLIFVDAGTGSGIASINGTQDITDMRVTDNDIRDAAAAGIDITGSNNKRWDVRGNRVVDSGRGGTAKPGIKVDGASDVNVTDNRCRDSGASGRSQNYGLMLTNVGGHVLVTNNDFSNNETGGINRSGGNPTTTHVFENVGDDLA